MPAKSSRSSCRSPAPIRQLLAQAARYNVERGAQIIDINMGCPAKKVCNVMAGSALMQDEPLVAKILETVVKAVPGTPVTLKFRTGWNRDNKNAPAIARIAQESGIRAIAIHGRTRADQYQGHAEYDTIAQVKSQVNIPVIANGDITTPEKAKFVLDYTQADGVMIGRAAQGRPWLFREIEHFLKTGADLPAPTFAEIHAILRGHLADLYAFYGEDTGVKIARKHISWYTKGIVGAARFRHAMNQLEDVSAQLAATDEFFLGAGSRQPADLRGGRMSSDIADCVRRNLNRYFRDLDGESPHADLRHGACQRREARCSKSS